MCRVGLVGWDPETWFSATDVDVLFSRTENMISEENISPFNASEQAST